jgi:hypothetical protein
MRTARLHPATLQDTSGRSYWVRLQERYLQMGAGIGGRHTVTVVTTILTRQRIVARITEVMVIIIPRLTMTLLRALTGGDKLPTALTDRRREAPVTILTPARMREVLRFPRLMAAEARRRHITRTPAPMRRRDRVRARTLSGVAPMSREETTALPWATTRRPMAQWQAPLIRREERWPLPAQSGETVRLAKLPVATCMPDTMATFIRTPVMAGRSTITEVGTR